MNVAQADATNFDTCLLFGVEQFDDVFISYSLSMIPDWTTVLQVATSHMKPNGRLHIIDFGTQDRIPMILRFLLSRWLLLFDVVPRHNLNEILASISSSSNASLDFRSIYRGYAQYAVLRL